jgi:endonuclease/exonuclease/phosphatase family metal-dependent hydrolase
MMVLMRVLCWNMGAAYGRWHDEPDLHERSWQWLAALDPDVAFLQEVRPPGWVQDHWSVVIRPFQFWGSAIIAKPVVALAELGLTGGSVLDRFGAYLATAQLTLADGSVMLVASVHTSAHEAPSWGHLGLVRSVIARASVGVPWWNDVAFAGYRELAAGRRFLIAGDWNTSRYVNEQGVANAAGAEFFDRAAGAGWVDVSLDEGGDEVKTWYGFETAHPHQPDHAFADPWTAALVHSFRVDATPVTMLGLSDHAPLLFDFDLEPERHRPRRDRSARS